MKEWDELEIEKDDEGNIKIVHSGLNSNECAIILVSDNINTDLPESMINEITCKMVELYNNHIKKGE